MRIIEEANQEKRCTCPHCNAIIGYTDEDDIYPMKDGIGIMCPKCTEDIIIEHCKPYEFPKTYYHFGGKNAFHMENDEINKLIKKGLQYMKNNRNNDDGNLWYAGTGDTTIWMYRSDDNSVEVNVAQGYYSSTIDYDWID